MRKTVFLILDFITKNCPSYSVISAMFFHAGCYNYTAESKENIDYLNLPTYRVSISSGFLYRAILRLLNIYTIVPNQVDGGAA